jgi:hypothetical protein
MRTPEPELPLSLNQAYLLLVAWWQRMTRGWVPIAATHEQRLRVSGQLDVAALETAIGAAIRRHQVLRTAVRAARREDLRVSPVTMRQVDRCLGRGGSLADVAKLDIGPGCELLGPFVFAQKLRDTANTTVLQIDASNLTDGQPQNVEDIAVRLRSPFDDDATPRVRAGLIRTEPNEYTLILAAEFFSCDCQSLDILAADIFRAYASICGCGSTTAADELRYADQAVRERSRLVGARLNGLLDYWRHQWGLLRRYEYPIVGPMHAREGVIRQRRAIDPAVGKYVATFVRQNRLTPYTLFAAAVALALRSRATGEVVPIMATVPNRVTLWAQQMVGPFANAHVMAFQFRDEWLVQDAIRHAATVVANLRRFYELPSFGPMLWGGLETARVRASFRMLRPEGRREVGHLILDTVETPWLTANAALDFHVVQANGTTQFGLDADARCYDKAEVASVLDAVTGILARLVCSDSSLSRVRDLT